MATSKGKKAKKKPALGKRGGKRPDRADLTGKPDGKPPAITADVLSLLVAGFEMGMSDDECCLHAGIGPATLYRYCAANPEFGERKELLKKHPKMLAKRAVHTGLQAGDIRTAQWYLERRDPEFREKQQIDTTVRLKDDAPDLAEAALKVL